MFQTATNFFRLWHVARTLSRYDALIPHEYASAMPGWARFARALLGSRRKNDASPGTRLAKALENLGPAHIKLGQVLATRPDIVGAEIATALEGLQDRLPPFPTADARDVIGQSLSKPVDQLFSSFGDAVAAASIAQVHSARLAENSRHVAVKVLRPGIEEEFSRELSALAFAARMAERFSAEARRLRLIALVETLATSVALELDLRMEAAAASELAERTRQDTGFRVPAVMWDMTSSRVLTSEWIDGIPLRDHVALMAAGHDPKKIAVTVVRTFLSQALRDGFFHADMHPGNLFIDHQGHLVAVDFGIMGRLDPTMRRFMAETLAGFLARDYTRVARIHYDVSFVPSHHPVETFAQALRAIGEPIFGRPAREMSMARLLQQLFDTTRRFDMEAQPQLLLLQKTMVVVEGVARSLDPDFDMWSASRPVVEKWMLANVGPEARLRDVGEGVSALGRLAQNLPQIARNAESLSAMLADGGVRLHPDSANAIAAAQASRTRNGRIALWIVAAALVALAAILLHSMT
jgi:ubiquinone biosynthesis protein